MWLVVFYISWLVGILHIKGEVDAVFAFKFGSGCTSLSSIFWDIIPYILTLSVSCCCFDSARVLIPIRGCVNITA